MKENSSRGPKHGLSERQLMFSKAKSTTSLAEHGIGEKEIMLYDQIALEKHDYTATKDERIQKFTAFSSLPQLPRQRPDYSAANREC